LLGAAVSVLGFLAVLGPLVIVHELGHYVFARIFGVKAEVFSVGFGPKLWSRMWGETEVRVSAIPLGGYVKLLGEEDSESPLPPELQKRTLNAQKPWKRFFVFFGGPFFNFIFAIVVFMAILLIGEPQIASVVGRVVGGSSAERAGFQGGDRIVRIDGRQVSRFEEIYQAVNEKPGHEMVFDVLRRTGAGDALKVKPTEREGFSMYGEVKGVGEIDGLFPAGRDNQAGVSDPASAAWKAGIRTGSRITSMNSVPVVDWENLERRYSELAPGAGVALQIGPVGGAAGQNKQVLLKKLPRSRSLARDLGLHAAELFIREIIQGSPASSSGLRPGDRVVSVGGRAVNSFIELRTAVQKAGEKEGRVLLAWERDGKIMKSQIIPTATNTRDPALKKTVQYTIGIVPMLAYAEPETVIERVWNPFTLAGLATERMAVLTWRNLVSLRKMLTGDVSISTLGGPILIGKIAGESLSRGLIAFLTTMAILSVGLGILNLLPVPVFDGGHLMLLAIESVRGRRLTMRQMEIIQQVGLSIILLLMVIVIRNDIIRLPFFD